MNTESRLVIRENGTKLWRLRNSAPALKYAPSSVAALFEMLLITATVVMYGRRLQAEWGSDFGVYFVGSKSIAENFGLYTDFFDHKGPFFYGLMRVIGFFVPYTIEGAAVAASTLALLWLVSVALAARILSLESGPTRMLRVAGTAVLIGQNTNSSIALVQVSLILLGFACTIRFIRYRLVRWHFLAIVFCGLAVLTRIDAIVPLVVVLLGTILLCRDAPLAQISLLFGSGLLALAVLVGVFVGLSSFLHFEFASFWRQAVIFNVSVYRDYLNVGSESSGTPVLEHIALLLPHVVLASINGFLLATALLLVGGLPPKTVAWRFSAGSLLFGSVLLGAIGSAKDYHFLILIPWILAAILFVAPSLRPHVFKTMYVVFALASVLELFRLTHAYSCVLSESIPCPSPYNSVVLASDMLESTHFLINQGWPYLLANTQPEVSFTARFAFLPEESHLLLKLLEQKEEGDVFWLSDDTLDFVGTLPGSGVEAFMSNMHQHGPSVGPFTPFRVGAEEAP